MWGKKNVSFGGRVMFEEDLRVFLNVLALAWWEACYQARQHSQNSNKSTQSVRNRLWDTKPLKRKEEVSPNGKTPVLHKNFLNPGLTSEP